MVKCLNRLAFIHLISLNCVHIFGEHVHGEECLNGGGRPWNRIIVSEKNEKRYAHSTARWMKRGMFSFRQGDLWLKSRSGHFKCSLRWWNIFHRPLFKQERISKIHLTIHCFGKLESIHSKRQTGVSRWWWVPFLYSPNRRKSQRHQHKRWPSFGRRLWFLQDSKRDDEKSSSKSLPTSFGLRCGCLFKGFRL